MVHGHSAKAGIHALSMRSPSPTSGRRLLHRHHDSLPIVQSAAIAIRHARATPGREYPSVKLWGREPAGLAADHGFNSRSGSSRAYLMIASMRRIWYWHSGQYAPVSCVKRGSRQRAQRRSGNRPGLSALGDHRLARIVGVQERTDRTHHRPIREVMSQRVASAVAVPERDGAVRAAAELVDRRRSLVVRPVRYGLPVRHPCPARTLRAPSRRCEGGCWRRPGE